MRRKTEATLNALELTPHRNRGQSFLIDPAIAALEAAMIDLPPKSSIVEIGGGLGELTRALVDRGFHPITTIEIEPRLFAFLHENFKGRVTVWNGDALKIDIPKADAYVGNLPFSTSSPILDRLLSLGMEHGVFLLQREVAERLSSPPGSRSYGPLTILAGLHGEFLVARVVPASAFYPSPRVDGAIVVFRRREMDPSPLDAKALAILLRKVFSQRRKKLLHSLPRVVCEMLGPEADPTLVISQSDWPAGWKDMRPEEITAQSYVRLCNTIVARQLSRQVYMTRRVGGD